MKAKKKTSKLIATLGMLSVALSVFLCPANSITVHAAASDATIAAPCSDNIYYIYYSIGKKLYKRLWNGTKAIWVGPPIYVGELP